jgi:uncharacterized protein YciI
MRLAALTAALVLLAAPALAQGGGLYLLIYKAGPAWQAGKPLSEQGLRPHGAYMKSLFDDGRLVAGGPMTDTAGGLAIIRVTSEDEAKKVLAADPAILGGIFTAELHPWSPQFSSDKPIGR